MGMRDTRYEALADQIVNYSIEVEQGTRVLLELSQIPDEAGIALIRAIRKSGGIPFLRVSQPRLNRELLAGATDLQYELTAKHLMAEMEDMDAYVSLRGEFNAFEMSSVPSEAMTIAMRHLNPVMQQRVSHTRWCVLRWPTPGMAQQAGMTTDDFEDFYFKTCLLDYKAITPKLEQLAKLMEATDRVRILGPGTDLSFSIKGIPAMPCIGKRNLPDGEVYTAPVRDSVNGTIQYNTPTVYQGIPFESVALRIENGRIVEATAPGKNREINQILDSDEGARYFGEFALGVNPLVTKPMCNILFDEKIAGSFHLTPGQAYTVADNGNSSQIHWDLVCIQTEACGGGEIYFDDKLIRKNGKFIDPEFASLNPAE
jgi:aminopeptidase